MKVFLVILGWFVAMASCSLLEMSRMLWSRLVSGGLENIGVSFDPLRVPVVKVDQTEGNTTYRIVLRNLEIRGLNSSTLENVHVARGRLATNLSESEAGYVSYEHKRDFDDIIYRFHTLKKEPKHGDSIESGSEAREAFQAYDSSFVAGETRQRVENVPAKNNANNNNNAGSYNYNNNKNNNRGARKYYEAEDLVPPRRDDAQVKCYGNCSRSGDFGVERREQDGGRVTTRSRDGRAEMAPRAYGDRATSVNRSGTVSRTDLHRGDNKYENRPGFVDVIYADSSDQTLRRFTNLGRHFDEDERRRTDNSGKSKQELLTRARGFFIRNFTDEEVSANRRYFANLSTEHDRIDDVTRYAANYQERQGFYEQGMQLVYHFGPSTLLDDNVTVYERDTNEAKRRKREHNEDGSEDDTMHVIVRLRIPMLMVRASYLLTGKSGPEILRGQGLLSGNFTNIIADFTLELKEIGKNVMIVRAARARLTSSDRKVVFEGMDSKGPVEEILTHGLMAAEAVAAMLADDLATKALARNATEAMIYKLYSNSTLV